MAFSSSPAVAELQRASASRSGPSRACCNGVADGVTSIFGAITEIDHLRTENERCARRTSGSRAENARAAEIQRQNDQLTALLQLRSGLA